MCKVRKNKEVYYREAISRYLMLGLSLLFVFISAQFSGAQTYYFDDNGAVEGSGVTNGGVYNVALNSTNWSTSPDGTTTNALANRKANVFSAGTDAAGTSYTIAGTLPEPSLISVEEGNVTLSASWSAFMTPVIRTADGCSLTITANNDFYSKTLNFDTIGSSTIILNRLFSGSTRSGGLNKTGPGLLTVQNSANFSGGGIALASTVSEGRLRIQNGDALWKSGTADTDLTIGDGGTLEFENNITVAHNPITLSGTGYNSLGAINNYGGNNVYSYTNAIALAGDARINAAAGRLTFANGYFTNNYNLVFGGAGDLLVSNSIYTGTGSLTKDGAGSLTLAGTNTYTGATTISAGRLVLANALAAQNSTVNNNVSGGLAFSNATTFIIGALAGSLDFGLTNLTGSAVILSNGNNNASTTYSGAMSGAGSLVKIGTGVLTLSGANTYTGTTTVNAGRIVVSGTGSLSTSTALMVANGGSYYYQPTSLGAQTLGGLVLGDGSTIGLLWNNTPTNSSLTTAANITPVAGVKVCIDMAGIPASGSTYTVLSGGAGSTLNNPTYFLLNSTNFTFAINKTATSVSITLTSAAPLASAYWKGTTTAGISNIWAASDGSTDGNWAASAGGAKQALIPGPGANVYISATSPTVAPVNTTLGADMAIGTLTIQDTVNGLGLLADGHTLTIGAGITMNTGVPASSIGTPVTLSANQTWVNNSANTLTVSGAIGGAHSLTKSGSGTLILSAANTYSGVTTISSGQLILSHSLALQNSMVSNNVASGLVFSNVTTFIFGGLAGSVSLGLTNTAGSAVVLSCGNNNADSIYSGVINGSGSLVKIGSGQMEITNTVSSYSGGTTVSGGLLKASDLTLGSGSLALASAGILYNISGSGGGPGCYRSDFGKNITLNAGGCIRSGWAAMTVSGAIDGSGPLTIVNDNSVTLSNTGNSYSGDTIIGANGSGNNATLKLGASGVIPNSTGKGNVVFNASGGGTATLDLAGYSETINGLTSGGSGSSVVDNTTGSGTYTLTVGDNNQSSVFSGMIKNTAGTLALAKIGSGSLTLAGTNTFSGATTISAGRLILANALAAQNSTVNNNILGGLAFSNATIFIIGALAGSSDFGLTNFAGNSVTLSNGNNNASTTYSGVMGGAGSLVKNGTGVLTLSGANTYTGTTTVNAGRIVVSGAGSLSTATALTVANGGSYYYQPSSLGPQTLSGLTLNSGSTIGLSWDSTPTNSSLTTGANITPAAGANICIEMAGVPASGSTYTVLSGGAGSTLNNPAYQIINSTNYTFAVNKTATSVSLTPTTAAPLTSAYWKGTTTAGISNIWAASDGSADGNWAATAAGAKQALVPGSGANVYISANTPLGAVPTNTTLGTDMAIRTLTIQDTANGLVLNADSSTLTLAAGLSMFASVPASTISVPITLGASQTWTNNSANSLTVGTVNGSGKVLTKAGTGNLVINGSGSALAYLTLNAGTVTIGSGQTLTLSNGGGTGLNGSGGTINGPGAIALGSGAAGNYLDWAGTIVINAKITGAYGIDFYNSGTITLANTANDFTGSLTLYGTKLSTPMVGNTGSVSPLGVNGTINFFGGSYMYYTGTGETSDKVINLGKTTADTTPTIEIQGTGNLKFTANLTAAAATHTLNLTGSSAGTGEIAGEIPDGSGNATSIAKAGSGTWTLSGTNTYSGTTTISAGTLVIGGAGRIGSGVYTTNIVNNATLVYSSSASQEFSGVISGTGILTKNGAGMLVLAATNTYSGATTISNGTLTAVVGGSCSNSDVSVSPASGTNTLGVSVTNNTMQWTCKSLTTTGAGTPNLTFDFGTSVTPSAITAPLNVTGAATFTTRPKVTIAGNSLALGTYPLMTCASKSGSLPGTSDLIMPPGVSGTLAFDGTTLNLTIASIQPYCWSMNQTNAVLQANNAQTGIIYTVLGFSGNLSNTPSVLYQTSNIIFFTYINTNALGSADRLFYVITETTSGVISTNSLIFTAFRKQLDTNTWYKFALGIDYGGSNTLNSTLGSQLAQGLAGSANNNLADLFYLLDTNGNWQMCFLNAGGTWCDYGSGNPTNTTVLPWQSFWIKRRSGGTNAAPVYSGYCFASGSPVKFRANDWHMITWPFPRDRKEGEGSQQGWGFAAAGAKKGTSWLNSDVLTVGDGEALRFYYMYTNGTWCPVGQTLTASNLAFHVSESYYYMHRGTGMTWTATGQ